MKAKDFFTNKQRSNISTAIKMAELDTSGEIRVHIDSSCKGDAMEKASQWFRKLKMHKTVERNGILFYLAVQSRKFAIVGDTGIDKKVPEDFWDNIRSNMLDKFRKDDFEVGLCEGIEMTGSELKTHFPFQTDDVNELPDEVSFGEEEE